MTARAWVAALEEAETVGELLIGFRNHLDRDWPSDNAFLASVDKLIELPDTEFLLAAAGDGEPAAGVCQLRFRYGLWLAATDCWLEDLFVTDAARGKGLGRALLDLACERARARDCRRVMLDVHEANQSAWALYASAGFRMRQAGDRDVLVIKRLDDSP